MKPTDDAVDSVREVAQPLSGASEDYDRLLDLIGDARFVLLGEATHGTQEFYRERAEITKRLIAEKAFSVVWEHNSHIGDARATEMGEGGEINVGHLVRERYGDETTLIGFTTYTGSVTAASDWDAPAERKRVRPALEDSYESLFHRARPERFVLNLRDERLALLRKPRLERAIGVVYRPDSERVSHYFHADLRRQFDLILHFDHTRAVEPLERAPGWRDDQEAPETFPSGV